MEQTGKLTLLKIDLQISTDRLDDYLAGLLSLADAAIGREGVTLTGSVEDMMLSVQYAAYLYRKRREQETAMPRYLRWMLNNRIVSEKGGGTVG